MRMNLICVALLLFVAPGVAADTPFVTELVPRPGTGSSGSGVGSLILNTAETAVSYEISFVGLSSDEFEAHVHREDGSIAHVLPTGSPKIGVWTGVGFLDATALKLEKMYILIHTVSNPFGELRGNIVAPPVATEPSTWGALKALLASPR